MKGPVDWLSIHYEVAGQKETLRKVIFWRVSRSLWFIFQMHLFRIKWKWRHSIFVSIQRENPAHSNSFHTKTAKAHQILIATGPLSDRLSWTVCLVFHLICQKKEVVSHHSITRKDWLVTSEPSKKTAMMGSNRNFGCGYSSYQSRIDSGLLDGHVCENKIVDRRSGAMGCHSTRDETCCSSQTKFKLVIDLRILKLWLSWKTGPPFETCRYPYSTIWCKWLLGIVDV